MSRVGDGQDVSDYLRPIAEEEPWLNLRQARDKALDEVECEEEEDSGH